MLFKFNFQTLQFKKYFLNIKNFQITNFIKKEIKIIFIIILKEFC